MALYNYSKDCSCVHQHHQALLRGYQNRDMESALLLNSCGVAGGCDYPDGTHMATPGHSARLGPTSRKGQV